MAFGIAAGKASTAVGHVDDVHDDLGVGGFGGGVDGVRVGGGEVDALGGAEADFVGLGDELGCSPRPVCGSSRA
jgi:hypothetical protein